MRSNDGIPVLTQVVCDGHRPLAEYAMLGWFWSRRVRRQAAQGSAHQTARNLKKQGIPPRVIALLLRRLDGQ